MHMEVLKRRIKFDWQLNQVIREHIQENGFGNILQEIQGEERVFMREESFFRQMVDRGTTPVNKFLSEEQVVDRGTASENEFLIGK